MNKIYCYSDKTFSLFLSGCLELNKKKQFNSHLLKCKKCSDKIAQLKKDLVILEKYDFDFFKNNLSDNIKNKIERYFS